MLKDLLETKNCFKLVCGAGNEDVDEVEKLVYVYAKAGCRFFDLSANIDVLEAAKRGYKKTNIADNPYFCVSFGIKGDPHINKAVINKDKCVTCGLCEQVCPQNAITNHTIEKTSCIGCSRCLQACKHNAIDLYSMDIMPSEFLTTVSINDISCIELHATSLDEEDLLKKWQDISTNYSGLLSICIDRLYLGNKQVLERISKMISDREPYTTIIQADGVPMSGSDDSFKTTLQAVAMAEIIQNANLPVYLLLSGGTNTKTAQLAHQCGIIFNGISVGSYARKIVKKYILAENFYNNPAAINSAVEAAKTLVAF